MNERMETAMAVTPQQTRDFLSTSAPFDTLGDEQIQALVNSANLLYLTPENQQLLLEQNRGRLYLIGSGQFSVKDSDNAIRHLSEGDYFGYHGILDNVDYPLSVKIDEPGLVYCFAPEAFVNLLSIPAINHFFQSTQADAL